MRSFAAAWPVSRSGEIVQRPVGRLPWGQNIALLSKLEDPAARAFYAEDAPIAVARYVTAEMALTESPPSELQDALPDLPQLAGQLAASVSGALSEPAGGRHR